MPAGGERFLGADLVSVWDRKRAIGNSHSGINFPFLLVLGDGEGEQALEVDSSLPSFPISHDRAGVLFSR